MREAEPARERMETPGTDCECCVTGPIESPKLTSGAGAAGVELTETVDIATLEIIRWVRIGVGRVGIANQNKPLAATDKEKCACCSCNGSQGIWAYSRDLEGRKWVSSFLNLGCGRDVVVRTGAELPQDVGRGIAGASVEGFVEDGGRSGERLLLDRVPHIAFGDR